MDLSRRDLLKLGVGSAALWAAGISGKLARADAAGKKIPIALQLYSVRNDCAKDLPGTLAAVGKMGYQGVEFAGYYGRTAKELRKMLDQNGLKCCGTHTGLNTVTGDALQKTIEFNQTLGNRFLNVPSLPHDKVASKQAVIDTAKQFTELAAAVKSQGMRVGYHAHGPDFKKFDGETVWDIFFSHAGPDVMMQLDIGNCLGGGGDPYAILRKFPGRTATIHIKEFGGKPGAVIGEGTIRWKEMFELCETIAKTEWYIIEQEAYAGPALDNVERCLAAMHKMGK
jgi:sugar phosphate isomerase/epimerase